jgi:hypothetical protein
VVLIWASELVAEGAAAICARGEAATATTTGTWSYGAGGGAGGSVHLSVERAELADGAIDATGGAGVATVERVGGDGGTGRIRVDCQTVNDQACSEDSLAGTADPAVGFVGTP